MKKILSLLVCLMLVGCTSEEKTPELVLNEVYSAPNNPTVYQIEKYNELSTVLSENETDVEIAKAVAVAFAADFYTFSNKTGENDIGGINYFPSEKREAAKNYITFYYYKNYNSIKNQYGEESLPCVKNIVAVEPLESQFTDEEAEHTYPSYEVRLNITYEDTQISQAALKTETVITLVKYNDVYQVVEIQ